jgi:hypothetical protein
MLLDPHDFKTVTHMKKTATSTPPVGISAVNKTEIRRQLLISACNSLSLLGITKTEWSKSLFVSRLLLMMYTGHCKIVQYD